MCGVQDILYTLRVSKIFPVRTILLNANTAPCKLDNCCPVCYKIASMFTQLIDRRARRNALTILLGGAVYRGC